MHNQSKHVGQKPGGSKQKGPSQYKKPDIENYIDPFVKDSTTQSFITSEPLDGTSSELQHASFNSPITSRHLPNISTETVPTSDIIASQVTTIFSYVQPTASIFTSGATPQVAGTSQHTGTSATMNTLMAAAIAQLIQPSLTSQIGQFNFNSSHQLPLNILQAQQITSPPRVTSNCSFQIKFLTLSIKICAGCRKGYTRTVDGKIVCHLQMIYV